MRKFCVSLANAMGRCFFSRNISRRTSKLELMANSFLHTAFIAMLLFAQSSQSSWATDSFGWRLFQALPKNENACISPTSLRIALAALIPAAQGKTKTELEQLLELPESKIGALTRWMKDIQTRHAGSDKEGLATLTLAT